MPGPYPLATLACTVNASGIFAPQYADIFASLQASYGGIFGSDANLDPDSQDGQWLAVLAKAIDDSNQMAIAVYNQFSPATAVGVGLSSNVKLNGMRRQRTSNSQADVVLVGQAGRTIVGGIVGDNANLGTQWTLPPTVAFPLSGTITVLAVCTTAGAVAAAPNTLTVILTPSPGWQTANNPSAAVAGLPVEADAALRLRQSISTALPAMTVLEAIVAAVAEVAAVSRIRGYQNDGNTTDANGIPAHNIALVIQGGDPMAIAVAIASKKTPGLPTYGTTSEVVTDSRGVPSHINFFQLTNITMSALLWVTPLQGYVGSTALLVEAAVAGFLSGLEIGDDSFRGRLWSAGNLSGSAAVAATGQNQATLDSLSATYDLYQIAQARSNMIVTGGPYGAGSTTIGVPNTANYAISQVIAVYLDNGALFTTTVTGVTSSTVSFSPAVPALRSIQSGQLVYVAGDVVLAFNEAAASASANITVIT